MAKTESHVRKQRGKIHKQLKEITWRNKLFFKSITGKEIEGSYQNTQKLKPPPDWASVIDAEGNVLDTNLKEKTTDMINMADGYEKKLKNISIYLDLIGKINGESIDSS